MKLSASLLIAFASTAFVAPVFGAHGIHLYLGKKVSSSSYASSPSSNASAPLVTNTTTGVTYQGTSANGVEQFQNIFFGQSTAGDKRFAPPQLFVPPPNTTINATAPGAACPQPAVPMPGIPFFANVTNISEDCLSLRIARPANTTGKDLLPVMVWIYGGGDFFGQIYDEIYTPTGLVLQSSANGQPIIYVAINYRVNIFGFAVSDALQDANSLNAGLKDQRLGIQWVKDNIAAFGGDPDNITIFGESAGGSAIGLQITAYGGKYGFPFNRAIMQSGAINARATGNSSSDNFAVIAAKANCTSGGAASKDTITCLRALPMETLLEVTLAVGYANYPPYGFGAYGAVVDNDFLPVPTSELVKAGQFARNISLIVGWNADDGSIFTSPNVTTDSDVAATLASFPALTNASIAHILELYPVTDFTGEVLPNDTVTPQFYRASRIHRDITFVCSSLDLAFHVAKYASGTQATSRLYELNQTFFGTSYLGVAHVSDVPYVFDEVSAISTSASAKDLELAAQMSGSWAAFAATGDPVGPKGSNRTLSSWPVAFTGDNAVKEASPTQAVVNVLGGPSPGPADITLQSSAGPEGQEKLLVRCAYLNSLYGQLQA